MLIGSLRQEVSGLRGLLVVGCGYSGCEIARLAAEAGVRVIGTTRHAEKLGHIAAVGAEPVLWTAGEPLPSYVRDVVDSAVICAAPPWTQESDPTGAIADALRVLDLRGVVYLSSTAVYGDFAGEWVDEESPCAPDAPAGHRRLAAENLLLDRWRHERLPVRICRLPGIYGPGRSVLDRIREGKFRVIAGRVPWSNRIHVTDLARGALAAILRGQSGRIYLLTDGHPARLDEIGEFAAELLGMTLPAPLDPDQSRAEIHPNAWAMLTGSKRLSSQRMRHELGVEPLYPSFREGLAAIAGSFT